MNVEIGAEAAQFPEKEYINGIAVAVHNACRLSTITTSHKFFTFNVVVVRLTNVLYCTVCTYSQTKQFINF
jgi:hypothetical protein